MSMLCSFLNMGQIKPCLMDYTFPKNRSYVDEYMGKFPVIFLTLKGVDGLTS